jgi:hypothetical protein
VTPSSENGLTVRSPVSATERWRLRAPGPSGTAAGNCRVEVVPEGSAGAAAADADWSSGTVTDETVTAVRSETVFQRRRTGLP